MSAAGPKREGVWGRGGSPSCEKASAAAAALRSATTAASAAAAPSVAAADAPDRYREASAALVPLSRDSTVASARPMRSQRSTIRTALCDAPIQAKTARLLGLPKQ
jgi:hypothetical protein